MKKEIKPFCDKYKLAFVSGMGVYGFTSVEDNKIENILGDVIDDIINNRFEKKDYSFHFDKYFNGYEIDGKEIDATTHFSYMYDDIERIAKILILDVDANNNIGNWLYDYSKKEKTICENAYNVD
jgi:hypothetical protein